MIVIIDYGMGNLGAIFNMLRKVGVEAEIASEQSVIERAEKIILPGVGAFDNGMKKLDELGIIPLLKEKVLQSKTPLLGICLGMQLLTNSSEEGSLPGVGFINAYTIKFKFEGEWRKLKIPHMGWNTVNINKDSVLYKDLIEDSRFYFAHSYHIVCNKNEDILAVSSHGYEFVSSIQKENIFGVQFHPEKSHKYGMKLLKNFVEY